MARHSKSKYVSRPDGGLLTLGDLPPATIGRSVVRLKKDQSALGSAARLQALIESFSDYIWSVDPDGIYTYVSQGVASLLGYDPQELIGKTPLDIMPPSEALRVADFFRGTAAERRSFDRFENFVLNRNGCKVVLESSGVPVVDEAGVFRGYCGIDRDITARKQTEEKAQRQASQYAAMLAMTADGFGRFDADGWLLEVNDAYCRMSGYSRAELLNLRIQDIDAVEGAGEIAQQIQKVKTTGFG